MAKKKVASKPAGKALMRWEDRIAQAAAESREASANFGGKSNFLSARNGRFSYGGENLGDELNIVILRYTFENDYYEGDFDSDNPQPPVCYSFGLNPKEMKPATAVSEKQNETCAGCPKNEWGSSERGEGKACKNIVRFAFITEGELENPAEAEVAQFRVPVTSVKNFKEYIKEIEHKFGEHAAPIRFVTKMSVETDKKTQFQIHFELDSEIEDIGDEQAEALFRIFDDSKSLITADYPKPSDEDEDEKPKGKAANRRSKVQGKSKAKEQAPVRRSAKRR